MSELRDAMEREAKEACGVTEFTITPANQACEARFLEGAEWMARWEIERLRREAVARREQANALTYELDRLNDPGVTDDSDSTPDGRQQLEWRARHLRREAQVLDWAADSLKGALKP